MASSKSTKSCNYKMFKCFNRKFKITEASPPPDVKEIFSTFAHGGEYMSADQLHRFLVEYQGEVELTASNAERFLNEVLQRRNDIGRDNILGLDLNHFFYMLFFDDLNSPIKSEVKTLPLYLCFCIF